MRYYLGGLLPPVDESVLAEAALWLDELLFWPAFLFCVGGSDSAATAFDVDPAEVEEYARKLHDPDGWPFLVVALARGHRLYILFRNSHSSTLSSRRVTATVLPARHRR